MHLSAAVGGRRMHPRPLRPLAVAAATLVLVGSVTVLAHQPGPNGGTATVESRLVRSATAAAVTLVVGVVLLGASPAGTRRLTGRALEVPVVAFGIGLATAVTGLGMAVVLFLSMSVLGEMGPALGVAMVIGFALTVSVLGQVGFLAVGRFVSERIGDGPLERPGWLLALALGVVLSAVIGVDHTLGTVAFVLSIASDAPTRWILLATAIELAGFGTLVLGALE